jgi:GTP-binding protein
MHFSVNDSPMQGEEGTRLTSSMIRERLMKETETNVALRVLESSRKDTFEVRGRGELHLGVLIENMRREGFEMSVSPPRVVLRRGESKSDVLEPMEEVVVDVPLDMSGGVIAKLNKRKGEMKGYVEQGDRVRLTFEIPSRGLLGYSSEFKNDTSGQG